MEQEANGAKSKDVQNMPRNEECVVVIRLADESTAPVPLWGGSASYNHDTTVLDETLYPLVSGLYSRDSGVPRNVILLKAHAEV